MNVIVSKYLRLKSKILHKTIFQLGYEYGYIKWDSDWIWTGNRTRILMKPIKVYNTKTNIYEILDRYTCIHIVNVCEQDTRLFKIYKDKCDEDCIYLCTSEDLEKYSMRSIKSIDKVNIIISKNGDSVCLRGLDFLKHYDRLKQTNKLFAQIIDLFTNFEDEILSAFGIGIFDSLKEVVYLIDNSSKYQIDGMILSDFVALVDSIYNTVIELGEPRNTNIDIKNCIDFIHIKQEEHDNRQNNLSKTMQLRQDLLRDFNRPLLENR